MDENPYKAPLCTLPLDQPRPDPSKQPVRRPLTQFFILAVLSLVGVAFLIADFLSILLIGSLPEDGFMLIIVGVPTILLGLIAAYVYYTEQ
jgi:hypothetical protein